MKHRSGDDFVMILWLIMIPLAIVLLVAVSKQRREQEAIREAKRAARLARELAAAQKRNFKMLPPSDKVRVLMDEGQWLEAWRMLQKIAYVMVRPEVPEDDRRRFKGLMMEFAARDPNYRRLADGLIEVVRASPGIRQATLLNGVGESQKELVRYALYFADALGEINRVKKGNSYALFVPSEASNV